MRGKEEGRRRLTLCPLVYSPGTAERFSLTTCCRRVFSIALCNPLSLTHTPSLLYSHSHLRLRSRFARSLSGFRNRLPHSQEDENPLAHTVGSEMSLPRAYCRHGGGSGTVPRPAIDTRSARSIFSRSAAGTRNGRHNVNKCIRRLGVFSRKTAENQHTLATPFICRLIHLHEVCSVGN